MFTALDLRNVLFMYVHEPDLTNSKTTKLQNKIYQMNNK